MEIYRDGIHYYYRMAYSVQDAVDDIVHDILDEDLQLARLLKVSN